MSDFWTYNALDSIACLECFHPIINEVIKDGNLEAYDASVSLLEPLMAMQYRGIRVDREGLAKVSVQAGEEIATLQEKLNSMVGYEVNVNSPPQMKKLFYIEKGYKPYTSRGTGQISVDEDALIRLERKGAVEAALVLQIRGLRKQKSSYLDISYDDDNRLRGSFNPAGTSSGRLSVSKMQGGIGLNLQTLPHSLYQYILADEDYILYSGDLSQAENRMVAYIAPEPAMIAAFEAKVDIHKQTASLIYGKPIAEILDEERKWGKKSNHGLNYGLGYKSFAIIHKIQEAFSKWVCEKYHSVYPGVRNSFHARVKDQLQSNRTLTNLFGRSRKFFGRWGDELFKDAYSYIPQSTVGEMINRWALLFLYYTRELRPVELLNNMHDGVWFQIPISAGLDFHEKACRALRKSMEQPLSYNNYSFSIPFELKAGLTLGLCKTLNWDEPLVPQLQKLLDVKHPDVVEPIYELKEFSAEAEQAMREELCSSPGVSDL